MDMALNEIGIVKVRMVFHAEKEPGTFRLNQDCGRGCKCESKVSRFSPSIDAAACLILCFNDTTQQGVSGRGCTGKALCEGPDTWVYDIDAKLSELGPGQRLEESKPFPKTRNTPPPMPSCKAPRGGGLEEPTPIQLRVDACYEALEKLDESMRQKAQLARETARKARKKGDTRKWDKYSAIARVYEMSRKNMWSCYEPLYPTLSEKFRDSMLPF
jgi:hypothetical protein